MVNARKRQHQRSFTIAIIQILLLFNSIGATTPQLYAQSAPGYLRLVRFMEADQVTIQDPAGLLFVDAANSLLVLPEGAATAAGAAQSQVTAITTYDRQLGAVALPQQVDPRTAAYDAQGKRLFFFDPTQRQLLQYPIQANGLPATASVQTVAPTGITDVIGGIAIGANSQELYLLATDTLRIHKLDLRSGQLQADATAAIDLRQLGLSQARGLTRHPQSGHLFTLDPTTQRLYELTTDGLLLTHYDLTAVELQDAQGFTFGPSSDMSDDPAEISLYVSDRLPAAQAQNQPANANLRLAAYLPLVIGGNTGNSQAAQTTGRIAELSFEQPVVAAKVAAVPTDVATLVRTVKTFEWSPPSPDPSDITYISSTPYLLTSNRLLVSDGEVDEMPIYAGANLYETTLDGVLKATYTTLQVGALPRLTREPVGMSFNPNNGHLFISDDDGVQPLIEIDPGPDKIYRTADDTTTSFSISAAYAYNNPKYIDSEGVEYARIGNEDYLFFADGLNSDVHIVKPGPNGKFDGVDDQVTHFDSEALGVLDPEGIAYNKNSGTLFLVGAPVTRIAEIALNGTLLRYIDFAAAKAKKPAGLTFAPGSVDPNQWNLYIVDRNVDNNSNRNENDGYYYEIAIPTAGNQAPIVDAGLALTVTLPATATLNATVTDDGKPEPPAVTTTWSKVSGPGTVAFGNANSVDTTASFSLPGDYVLQLFASDGQLSNSDTVNVKVLVVNQPPTVNAGVDQNIEVGTMATLSAQVSDDGWPTPPNKVTITWEKVSGTGNVTFTSPTNAATTASFSAIGDYVLRITASDSLLNASDEITIHVLDANTAPTVDAGVDHLIGRNDALKLVGSVSDDGLPNPPAQVAVTWGKVKGPGSVAFTPTNQLSTTVTFTALGVYVLRLTANDGALNATDEVTVTVTAPNQPPTVDAGPDQSILLTTTATLAGSASDDGIPNPPGAVAVEWQLQSGPGNALFSDPHALTTTVHFTAVGVYTLRLTASDSAQEANDTVTITVVEPDAGIIILGQSQTTDVGKVITLTATISGAWGALPAGTFTYAWSQVSGPGAAKLGAPADLTTTATFTIPGEYILQLAVTHGNEIITSTVVVQVNAINQAPLVNAGADQSIAQPGTIQLAATVNDDGLPTSPGKVTVQWTRVSGPAEVVFANNSSTTTTATFSAAGTYTLMVTADDGQWNSEDTLTVAVGSNNSFSLFLPVVRQ